MPSKHRFVSWKLTSFAFTALLAAACCGGYSGCNGNQSSEEALKNALTNAGQSQGTVFPFAGKVTIDGQPPHFDKAGKKVVVMLNDTTKPDVPVLERPYVIAGPDGDFSFSTYKTGDGVKPGKYVVTFAVLQRKGKRGFLGPDLLNNLYNDPDKNAQIPEFVIDQKSPGKSDYAFNLEIQGKEPVKTPGPHALTTLEIPTK